MMIKYLALSLIAFLCSAIPTVDKTEDGKADIRLTEENFKTVVNGSKYVLVKFYAPCTLS